MSSLTSVPVRFVTAKQAESSGNLVLPVLHEIAAMLEALLTSGQANSIDLRRAPLDSQDLKELRDALGIGEIIAHLDCLGSTRIQETSISGVWLITHYDEQDRILGEFIEVARCPEMLSSSQDDMRSGLDLLHAKLSLQQQQLNVNEISDKLKAMGFNPSVSSKDIPNVNQQVKRGHDNAQ